MRSIKNNCTISSGHVKWGFGIWVNTVNPGPCLVLQSFLGFPCIYLFFTYVSHVRCQVPGVGCQVYLKKNDKVVDLVGGGSHINRAYPVLFPYIYHGFLLLFPCIFPTFILYFPVFFLLSPPHLLYISPLFPLYLLSFPFAITFCFPL